jgi:hypothetical protein
MPELNWISIVVAAVAAFIVSTVYYIVFAARMVDLRGGDANAADGGMQPWKVGVQAVRDLVLATVAAALVALVGVTDVAGALALGAVLWIGFPVVLLVGSVIWENVSPALAAIHAGDWLVKLLIVTMVVTLWP